MGNRIPITDHKSSKSGPSSITEELCFYEESGAKVVGKYKNGIDVCPGEWYPECMWVTIPDDKATKALG